jgi:predicted Zn-dependent protease
MIKIADKYLLAAGVLGCLVSGALLMTRHDLQEMVSFDSVMEVGESALHHIDKTAGLFIVRDVSEKEEMETGNRIRASMVRYDHLVEPEDELLHAYLSDIGAVLVKNITRPGIKYQVHAYKSDAPNAFAIAGGHVYISTGLLKILDTEAEVAAVLAHEIAHVDAKHCISFVQRSRAAEYTGEDSVDNYGYQMVRSGYSEVEEDEADTAAIYLIEKSGYHPMALVAAFEAMDRQWSGWHYQRPSLTPAGDIISALGGTVDRYFGSHPEAVERINNVKRYMSEKGFLVKGKKYYIGKKNFADKRALSTEPIESEYSSDHYRP